MQKIEDCVPSLASWDFHVHFFPALLIRKFRPVSCLNERFVPSTSMEGTPILAIAVAVIAVGTSFLPNHPLIGMVLLVPGIAGIGYVLYHSIAGAKGIVPSYDNFLFGLFFFVLMLGANAGLIAAIHDPWGIRILSGMAGAAAGYLIGLLAGIHAQRLGFVATILDQLAVLGAIGAFIPAILLALPQ